MDAPEGLILKAMVNGVQKGRDGKGSLFVFAAGNGGGADDQCNFDGYTNSIYSITIGALDRKGLHPYYSEMCAALLAVAYSSGSGDAIVSSTRLCSRSVDRLAMFEHPLISTICLSLSKRLTEGRTSAAPAMAGPRPLRRSCREPSPSLSRFGKHKAIDHLR